MYSVKIMMDEHKTKEQLMHELAESRLQVGDLKTLLTTYMQQEETLKETEEILQALINATRETLLLIDTGGTVLLANEVVAQRLGKSVKELIGSYLYDHFPPEVTRVRKEQHDKVILSGEPVHFEDARGGMFFETYCYPVFDKEGKASRVAIFSHEITERKEAERKLVESEERYRIAIEHSNDGVALLRGDKHIYVNKKFLEIFGYDSPDEVIGKTHELTVHPDALPMVIEYNRKRQRGEPAPSNYEFKGIRKDGTPIFVDISGAGTIFRGEPVALVYFRDITERKRAEDTLRESEERYRSIFDNAIEGIYQGLPGGQYISVNPALARMHGFESPQEMMTTVTDIGSQIFVNPEDQEKYREIVEKEGAVVNFEFELYRKDRSKIWVSTNARAVRNNNGETLYYEGTVEDITSRKQAEEERTRLESQLRHAQKMEAIGTLAGGIAHDFNNLLMGIRGYASLMLMEFDPSHPHYEKLTRIESQVQS
ncbi:MAG: PAS domain S-box protein, partial [Proteobacteria bacterium]|nr:PAS domain S-box protein [Pseudomonadota bacterium]